ncbi:hypothetical protein VNO77_26007 [Canavalia gladiata]|uniref:Uncharacterized protein n=1 Tax=Canavalia gladiata TaxID=3824 RepID=A0AAN9KUK5_CANGL
MVASGWDRSRTDLVPVTYTLGTTVQSKLRGNIVCMISLAWNIISESRLAKVLLNLEASSFGIHIDEPRRGPGRSSTHSQHDLVTRSRRMDQLQPHLLLRVS